MGGSEEPSVVNPEMARGSAGGLQAARSSEAVGNPSESGLTDEISRNWLCLVCGRPVPWKGGGHGRPHECHRTCGRVLRALRLLEVATFDLDRCEPGAALAMRRRIISMANAFPGRWQRPRSANGRFSKGVPDAKV